MDFLAGDDPGWLSKLQGIRYTKSLLHLFKRLIKLFPLRADRRSWGAPNKLESNPWDDDDGDGDEDDDDGGGDGDHDDDGDDYDDYDDDDDDDYGRFRSFASIFCERWRTVAPKKHLRGHWRSDEPSRRVCHFGSALSKEARN